MSNLIEDFYETIKHKYPITLEECKVICSAPFKFVKEILNRNLFKNIRLQYFGVFTVSSSRLGYSIKSLEESYKKGLIPKSRYEERMKVLTSYESKNKH